MKACKRLLPLLLTVLCAPYLLGQVRDPMKEREAEMHKANIERFIPKYFSRVDTEDSVNLLKDVEPLIEKLDAITPANSKIFDVNDYGAKPRKVFGRNIETTLSEEAESKRVSLIWLRIWSYDSFKRAEEGLAANAAMIPVVLKAGSLTGRDIGELSYHSADQNRSVYIIFLRRSIVVSIACKGPMEVPKETSRQPGPFLNDPELKNKCESLAKKIDEFITHLTNRDVR